MGRSVEFIFLKQGQMKRAGVEALFVYQTFEDSHFGLLQKMVRSGQNEEAIHEASMSTRRGLRETVAKGL